MKSVDEVLGAPSSSSSSRAAPPPAAAGELRDKRGRPFHQLLHEVNGDGTPALCTSGANKGKLRLKRGAQGKEGEREYARLVAEGRAGRPDAAGGRDAPAVRDQPADPDADAGGVAGDDGAGDMVDDAADPGADDLWLPGRGGAEDVGADAGDAGDEPSRDWGGLILMLLLFAGGCLLGRLWWVNEQEARSMQLDEAAGFGRFPAFLRFLQRRVGNDQAVEQAGGRLQRLKAWFSNRGFEEQQPPAREAAAGVS